MLGVVIGVGAVIALVAVGAGAQAQVVSQFQSLGSNLLTVTAAHELRLPARRLAPEHPPADPGRCGGDPRVGHQRQVDRAGLQQQRHRDLRQQDHLHQHHRRDGRIRRVRNWSVRSGRFIIADDDDDLAMVVVLGQTTVKNLFGSTQANPIGETIRINRQNYRWWGS